MGLFVDALDQIVACGVNVVLEDQVPADRVERMLAVAARNGTTVTVVGGNHPAPRIVAWAQAYPQALIVIHREH